MIVSKSAAEGFLGKRLDGLGGGKRSYYVLSEDGTRNFGGPYTKSQAKKRLGQVEYFKHNPERKKLYIYPNAASRKVARSALERRKKLPKSKRGGLDAAQAHEQGIGSGVMRARDIAAGKRINAYQVKAFFDRHRQNYLNARAAGKKWEDSKAWQAWDLWGGEPLRKQVEAAVRADKKERARANPSSFSERSHDWDEVLIQRAGIKKTRRQIRDYYLKNEKKIWPFLEGQAVMVILAPKKNEFVRRRNLDRGVMIRLKKLHGIEDPSSFEYWINRRVIEFHPTLTTKSTPLLWLDLDMHTTKGEAARKRLLGVMRRAIPKIKSVFKDMGVRKVHVYTSGTSGGIHFEGDLDRPRAVDSLRRRFTKALREAFEDDDRFTTGLAKSGQIRLDTTTLHTMGSLRAPYSMTITGSSKKPIKS